jgi:predicted amidophosphoribosyltransferase
MIACQSCGKALEATARICPSCGALTGVSAHKEDEAAVRALGFSAAAVVAFFVYLTLKWIGLIP